MQNNTSVTLDRQPQPAADVVGCTTIVSCPTIFDLATAQRFLETLGGPNAVFTFQTFLDSEQEKARQGELEM